MKNHPSLELLPGKLRWQWNITPFEDVISYWNWVGFHQRTPLECRTSWNLGKFWTCKKKMPSHYSMDTATKNSVLSIIKYPSVAVGRRTWTNLWKHLHFFFQCSLDPSHVDLCWQCGQLFQVLQFEMCSNIFKSIRLLLFVHKQLPSILEVIVDYPGMAG